MLSLIEWSLLFMASHSVCRPASLR